jgi:thiopeptide-type bacteriocin biosynthesis protein
MESYRREIDRYGGPAGMALAEQIFGLDSRCCIHQIGALLAKPSIEFLRDRVAVFSGATLLNDLNLSNAQCLEVVSRLNPQDGQSRHDEHRAMYMSMKSSIRSWVTTRSPEQSIGANEDELQEFQHAIRVRSKAIQALMSSTDKEGADAISSERVAVSLLHMHFNRLLGIDRAAEKRVCYLLAKGYSAEAYSLKLQEGS